MGRLQDAHRAARLVGLKLLLLSASLAAVGAAAPGVQYSIAEVSWGGMKLLHLIFGTAAAGVSLFLHPQFTGRVLGATISCGILCAAAGTPAIAWGVQWWTDGKTYLPAVVENVLAIALGVGGVYIMAGMQVVFAAFKANPLGFLDWLRGKGGPPASPPGSAP